MDGEGLDGFTSKKMNREVLQAIVVPIIIASVVHRGANVDYLIRQTISSAPDREGHVVGGFRLIRIHGRQSPSRYTALWSNGEIHSGVSCCLSVRERNSNDMACRYTVQTSN